MSKKFLMVLVVLFVSVAILIAGGTKEDDANGKKQISMWFFGAATDYQAHMKKVLEESYNNSQDEYELTIEFRNTVDKDIPVALAADSGPDIVYASGPSFVATYAAEGKVLDLDDYSAEYGWKDRIQPVMYDACTIEGNLYSVPVSMTFDGFFYSKSLWQEMGWEIPTTIEELEQIFDEAIAAGLYAAAEGNKGWRPNNDTVASIMINHFISPSVMYECLTGERSFTDPEMVAAVEKTKEWYQKGYLAGKDYTALNSQETLQLVADKRAALAFNQCQYFQFAAQSFVGELEDDLGFAPLPSAYTDKEVHQIAIPSTLSINAASKYPDEAARILDMMMNEDFYMAMTEGWTGYRAGALLENNADISGLTGLPLVFMESVKSASAPIAEGYFGFHASSFFPPKTIEKWRDIDMVWEGVISAEEFCQAVADVAEEEIAEGLVCPLVRPSI